MVTALALGGCSLSGGGGNTPQDICARAADDSPVVHEMLRIGAGAPQYLKDNDRKLQQAKQDAMLACLRTRGLAPKGGVERPRV